MLEKAHYESSFLPKISLAMDPLSIVAAAGGLATLCGGVSTALYKFVGEAENVDRTVKAFSEEVDGLQNVLATIKTSFEDRTLSAAALNSNYGLERVHWGNVEKTMGDCE